MEAVRKKREEEGRKAAMHMSHDFFEERIMQPGLIKKPTKKSTTANGFLRRADQINQDEEEDVTL